MKTTEKIAPMDRWSVRLATWAVLAMAPVIGFAQNAIQAVTNGVQGGSEVIRLELSEPLAEVPKGFALQSPARVALDLPGVRNATGRVTQDINQGNLRSLSLAQGSDRTRLVLNLKQSTRYRAEIDGKTLVITLDPVAVAASTAATPGTVSGTAEPVRFAEPQSSRSEGLRDIDFRRGKDGAGRVVVDLPNNQVGVDIRQQGQNLIVEFLRTTASEGLRRRLDVTDFGTPVQAIATTQVGDRVRMVVEPRGHWEHSAYQTDSQFVLEVRPVKVDPQKLTQGVSYAGDKLSLNFQSIEVRALLQVIADFTNFNIVTSDTVTGNVTLRLKDVPWDQALDIIMQAKGLGVKKSGNVLWVAPKEELAAKDKAELESKAQVAALEPLRTQSFQLNYTKAEEVAKGLVGQQGAGGAATGGSNATRLLSARGSVISEMRTNQLFVTDIPSKLEEIGQMITKIDIPVRQVMIEARIVEAEDTFGRALGVKLGANDLRGVRGGVPGVNAGLGNLTLGGTYGGIGYQTGQSAAGDYANTQFVNLPANTSSMGGASAATFALSLFGAASNRFLNLELSALEAEGRGKLVSSPRVITADQVKALIEQGTELPYQTATSSGATAIQFRKANLKLEVIPQITPEGSIILDVDVNKDSVGQQTSAGYAINTKHVKTQVLVENGGTVVIGGIFEISETESVNKVPFLGDLPYVGALFRNKTRASNKTELLVFLTPKVITDRNAPAR
jgi:type IV pilus assembly protein PilQ